MNERLGSSNSHPLGGERSGLVFGTCFWCDSRWTLKDSDEQKNPPWKAKCPIFQAIVAGFGVKLPQKIGHLAFQVLVTVPDQSSLHSGPPKPDLCDSWPRERPRLNDFLHKVGALQLVRDTECSLPRSVAVIFMIHY